MSRRLVAALLLASVAAGCGVTPTDPFLYGDAPANAVEGVQLHFWLDNRIFRVMRPGARDLPRTELLDLLFAGPTGVELAAGITTALPSGYTATSVEDEKLGDKTTRVVLVDHPDGVDLDRFGRDAGRQLACTVVTSLYNYTLVVRDAAGGRRGPFTCE